MLQQTPSVQKPLAHWFLAVQAAPAGRFTWQALLSQKKPFWHSPSTLHTEAHEPFTHRFPPVHILVAPAWHTPAVVQVLAPVSVEPVQLPARHWVPGG